MSRKRFRTESDANKEWLDRQRREREAAAMRAQAQRKPTPGYRRLELDEEVGDVG